MLMFPKPIYIKSKPFLKWVASLPCMNCKVSGSTQAAHLYREGKKAKGKKSCDSQARPLCHEGANNCHYKLDRYQLWERERIDQALDIELYELWLKGDTDKALEIIARFR